MKDKDFYKVIEILNVGGGWTPYNENAIELLDNSAKGEIVSVLEVTQRDIKFHKCYFSLLSFIYDYLPAKFQKKVPKRKFYLFVKHLKGEYEVLFKFKDGTQMVEYDSISFGNMSQKRFQEYVKLQLPYIYENVLGEFFEGEMLDGIIATIEDQYLKFLSKL